MELLPSGLPKEISDAEDLARFLVSKRDYEILPKDEVVVKPSALLPRKDHKGTSFYRHGSTPLDALQAIGKENVKVHRLHGAAIINANAVRSCGFALRADEPPPLHADVLGWLDDPQNPEEQTAKRIKQALLLVTHADVVLFP